MTHLGHLIRLARVNKRYSQHDLQAIAFNSFKNGQFISNIERGVAPLPMKYLPQLIKVLGIDKEMIIDAMTKDYRERILKTFNKSEVLNGNTRETEPVKSIDINQIKRETSRANQVFLPVPLSPGDTICLS